MRKARLFLILPVLAGLAAAPVGCSKKSDPVIPPAACSISMTTPQAGEKLSTDNIINIRWERTTGDHVRIELFKGGSRVGLIAADHTNTGPAGFYPWVQPRTFGLGTGTDYAIRVTSLDDTECFGQTGAFELKDYSNCLLQFVWTGRDTIPDLVADRPFDIRWTTQSTSGAVDLELWYEPFAQLGTLVGVIARSLPDTGSYLWTVDSFNRGTDEGYRFKIRDLESMQCGDASLRFGIQDEVNCSIQVLGINDGMAYDPDQVIPLSFRFENASGRVDLKLYSGNEPVHLGLIADDFDTQNGTLFFYWSVSDYGHTGPSFDRFNIRAWDANDGYCMGKSDYFTITR